MTLFIYYVLHVEFKKKKEKKEKKPHEIKKNENEISYTYCCGSETHNYIATRFVINYTFGKYLLRQSIRY